MKTELCAGTIEAVNLAVKYQFDRVELCQQLEIGGLTPSIGLQIASQKKIETHVLIRVRGGDFVYSSEEKEIMLQDIFEANKQGMSGVVVGGLLSSGELDLEFLQEITKLSKGLSLTFHKAFDEVADWSSAMEALIELQFHRILTAGQATNVWNGKDQLHEMLKIAQQRIEIMAGGGITLDTISQIVAEIPLDAIHFSGTTYSILAPSSIYETKALLPDESKIQLLKSFCN
jgi:copper homeostasis protein